MLPGATAKIIRSMFWSSGVPGVKNPPQASAASGMSSILHIAMMIEAVKRNFMFILPLTDFSVLGFSPRPSPARGSAPRSGGCANARYAEVDVEGRDGKHCKCDIEWCGADVALGVDVERCQYAEYAENHYGCNGNGPAAPDTERAFCRRLAAAQFNDAEPCNCVDKRYKHRSNQDQYRELVGEKDDHGNGGGKHGEHHHRHVWHGKRDADAWEDRWKSVFACSRV